jgi:plastocyanin
MRVRLVLPLVAIAFAAACGSDDSTGPNPPEHQASIAVSDTGFAPDSLDAQLSTLVTWTVTTGDDKHVNRFVGTDLPNGNPSSDTIKVGESAATTFITAGTYHYEDAVHPEHTGLVYVH